MSKLIRPLPLHFRGMPFPILPKRPRLIVPQMGDNDERRAQMEQGDRTYSFDINNLLSDNAAPYTANGYAQAGGADGIVDLGGNQSATVTLPLYPGASQTIVPQQARIDAVVVVDVAALDIASTDERYTLKVLGCNSPAFTSGVVELGAIGLGAGATGVPPTQLNSPADRYEILFTNEQGSGKYQWVKLFLVVGGTTPSISFQAFIAVLPEP